MTVRNKTWSTLLATALVAFVLSPFTAAPATASAPTGGVNDWSCQPGPDREPVILMHGLGANAPLNFATLAPHLASNGFCVFMETYGTTYYGPTVGGLDSMRTSAEQLSDLVDRVLDATGAEKVDIVGHSEGTTVPAYYLKFGDGADKVDQFIGFGSNFEGTTLHGLGLVARAIGFGAILRAGGCIACDEFLPGSDFLADLNEGGLVVDGPSYTSIISKLDTVVVPYTSGRLPEADNTRTIVLQDACALDFAGHLSMAVDPNVAGLILAELDPSTGPVRCVPFFALGL